MNRPGDAWSGAGASDGSFEVPVGLRPLFDRRTTYAFDLAVMALAFGLAYLLRFEFAVPPEHRHHADGGAGDP